MKTLAVILNSLGGPLRKRNSRMVIWLVVGIIMLIGVYTAIFHQIMAHEGRSYSWITGIYWTLTVMSTLGFGDITFHSDLGRLFSVIVLISGALLILVLLPFVFIQFVFRPWMDARDASRVPRRLAKDVRDHLILTRFDPVAETLIRRLDNLKIPYTLIVDDHAEALALRDQGYEVMVGRLDDPATYAAARADVAALVVATRSDETNTNIVFTATEFDRCVRTVATASSESGRDVLVAAGCDTVLRLGHLLGRDMAQRVMGVDARSRAVGEFGDLIVAEANAAGTSLAGATIGEANLRQRCAVNIAGVWSRGVLELPDPDLTIDRSDVLVLVGTEPQLDTYDQIFGLDRPDRSSVIVVGGGRVGRAAAQTLEDEGVDTRLIEKRPDRIGDATLYVQGDAADLEVLERAGFSSASSILITTHDDDVNIYLTIYCRQLAPEMQIIARSNMERNVATLHRAGADSVLSYASQGATAILNAFGDSDHLVLAEGLEMFSVPTPESITGQTLRTMRIPEQTDCNIVAVTRNGHTTPNPDPDLEISADASLVVIGSQEAERRFLERFPLKVGRASLRDAKRPMHRE